MYYVYILLESVLRKFTIQKEIYLQTLLAERLGGGVVKQPPLMISFHFKIDNAKEEIVLAFVLEDIIIVGSRTLEPPYR